MMDMKMDMKMDMLCLVDNEMYINKQLALHNLKV